MKLILKVIIVSLIITTLASAQIAKIYIRMNDGSSDGIVVSEIDSMTFTGKYVNISSPNGGERWKSNTMHTIKWEDNIDENVKIELWRGTTLETTIATSTLSDGEFRWVIGDFPKQSDYKIKIVSISDTTIYDKTDNTFSITDGGSSCEGITTVTYKGKDYNVIQIGSQCWFKENLDVGTMVISDVNLSLHQQTDNGIIEKYCYDNDPSYCEIYGGLYEWYETMEYVTAEGTQGICPSGWHIPAKYEFEILENYVNDNVSKLVDEGEPTYGYTPTNETGFSGLFAGFRQNDDEDAFGGLNYTAFFWSSTEVSNIKANSVWFRYSKPNVIYQHDGKYSGESVRCVKD